MTVTLVFGGTFDPVHIGHLRSAKALLARFDDAKLVMVPCQIPPHRPQPAASAQQRLAMLELATAAADNIGVDDIELKREGKSFTFDTLSAYRQQAGDTSLCFVMGYDAWVTLPSWYRWQELTELAHLVVLTRPGDAAPEPEELKTWSAAKETDLENIRANAGNNTENNTDNYAGNIVKLTLEQVPVSATCIRAAIKTGRQVADLVPPNVVNYIEQEKLYV